MGGGGRFILFNRTLVSKTAVAPTRMMVTAATTKEDKPRGAQAMRQNY
jgi:hypothetical protein